MLTWQTFGSARARLLSTLNPYDSAAPASRSHKQTGYESTSQASSGQHGLSGLVKLLPVSTYDKQSVTFNSALKHSVLTDGVGDGDDDGAINCAFVTYVNISVRETIMRKKVLWNFWKDDMVLILWEFGGWEFEMWKGMNVWGWFELRVISWSNEKTFWVLYSVKDVRGIND